MAFAVSKKFKFEAAHRLVHGYEGACASLHGHGFCVVVTASGDRINGYGKLSDSGAFDHLEKWISDNLDNSTIVSFVDKSLMRWLKANDQKCFVMPSKGQSIYPNPTSEELCIVIHGKAKEFGLGRSILVEINDTCTSSARFYG